MSTLDLCPLILCYNGIIYNFLWLKTDTPCGTLFPIPHLIYELLVLPYTLVPGDMYIVVRVICIILIDVYKFIDQFLSTLPNTPGY